LYASDEQLTARLDGKSYRPAAAHDLVSLIRMAYSEFRRSESELLKLKDQPAKLLVWWRQEITDDETKCLSVWPRLMKAAYANDYGAIKTLLPLVVR